MSELHVERIYVFRSFEADSHGHISAENIKSLQALIREHLLQLRGDVHIIASPDEGSRRSAEELAHSLTVDHKYFEERPELYTGRCGLADGTPREFETISQVVIRPRLARHVIMVAKYEFVLGWPHSFATNHLGVHVQGGPIPCGAMWIIDCQAKKMEKLTAERCILQSA